MLVLYTKWKKYNEFQLTKNKMDLKNRKLKIIHPPPSKCSEKLQYEVQKCMNIAAKVACNGKYLKRDHVTPLLRDLKWINFNSILQLNEASFMYKNLYVSADSNVKKINFDL